MEKLTYTFDSGPAAARRAHVGVVASGDLEILAEPNPHGRSTVVVTTSVDGFGRIWGSVLERFFSQRTVAVDLEIYDAGATPGTVSLRLHQISELIS